MKRIKPFILGFITCLLLTTVVNAEQIEVLFNTINLAVNGVIVEADNISYNETTYVPIRKVAELFDKDVSWDQDTMTVSINDVVYNDPERDFYANKDEFMNQTSGEIIVECDKDVVYVNPHGEWKWSLYLYSRDNKPIEIKNISIFVYTYENEYNYEAVYLETDMNRWWGSSLINIDESKRIGAGNGNPQDHDIWFYDYYVEGIDEDGNEIEGRCRVNFSKKVEETVIVPPSEYDTKTLRHNADFRAMVAKDVYWVPANVLGQSNLTANEIEELGSDPTVLKENIDTLYEVIQYIQVADFKDANDNINIKEGMIDWEHHKPGEMAIITNEGCCATISNLLNYLLEGDYDEVGFMSFSRSDGSGHVFNYIKENGKYYIVDLTHYRNDYMNTAIENGSFEEYKSTDYISGNIHEVENFIDYTNFCISNFAKPPVLFSTYVAENVLPIESVRDCDNIYITYPESYKDKVNIVYDKKDDNVSYDFATPPKMYPKEWEPYNTKH